MGRMLGRRGKLKGDGNFAKWHSLLAHQKHVSLVI